MRSENAKLGRAATQASTGRRPRRPAPYFSSCNLICGQNSKRFQFSWSMIRVRLVNNSSFKLYHISLARSSHLKGKDCGKPCLQAWRAIIIVSVIKCILKIIFCLQTVFFAIILCAFFLNFSCKNLSFDSKTSFTCVIKFDDFFLQCYVKFFASNVNCK